MSFSRDEAVLLLTELEGETLGHTIKNLLTEVKRLREKNEKLHSRCMHLENLLEEWQGAYE